MKAKKNTFATILTAVLITIVAAPADAQYFGRNKPQYQSFDFEVLKTPHFEIYNYLENDSILQSLGVLGERWYKRHQAVLSDTFKTKNPVIIYNDHADFQQTDVISGLISVGTGGVTEGLRNRVVMPFLQTFRQTDHVLGHELVHAFQFHMLTHRDSTSLSSIRNLPLWLVEGLAEYLSIGRTDAHTAMWMRDAIISEDMPTLREMTINQQYFPYRYGQAFWAFTTGVYGDTIIEPLYMRTAQLGYDMALKNLLKIDEKTFSAVWKNTLIETYKPLMKDTIAAVGEKRFSPANAGQMNLTPVFSPDGRYIAFLSEKDLLSIDLYLADAKTGKIIRKLSRAAQRFHIDDYSYIETAGTFSPDGNRFAYVAFSKGRNKLIVTETVKGRTLEEIEIDGLKSFSDPAWSPDGRYIALSGLKQGQTDLYLFDYVNHNLIQLTDDLYSEIQPSWSHDGKKIVFVSDRGFDANLEELEFGSFKLNLFDVETGAVETLDFFPGADNMNPEFSADNKSIYFLSNADGFRNLYEYRLSSGDLFKLTKYFTGISGITAYSPAITVNPQTNDIAYSLFREGKYTIYQAHASDFPRFSVDPYEVDFTAAVLPPHSDLSPQAFQEDPARKAVGRVPVDSFNTTAYQPTLGLTHISNNGGFGVGTSSMGTGFAGGVNMLFSDILNDHQLFAGLSLNGEIYDFGAQGIYLNRKSKINWGFGISHIPYLSGYITPWAKDTVVINEEPVEVDRISTVLQRTFEDQVRAFAHIPFSQTLRLEAGASFARYSFRRDEFRTYYYGGYGIGSDRQKIDAPDGFNVGQTYLAYVGDNSKFGVTAPLDGARYRFQIEKYFGELDYYGVLADYRKYFYLNRISLAFRGMHYARYGGNVNTSIISPLVIGSDYLVRGYNINSINRTPCPDGDCLSFNQLIGTRMAVVNAEVRIPFSGPKRLALFPSGLFFSDLAFFADAGLVWDKEQDVEFSWKPRTNIHSPIFSAGVTLRVNLFNMAILEPYYAFPFQREDVKGTFGLVLTAGGW